MNNSISFNGSPRFSEPLSASVSSQNTGKSEVAAKNSGHINGDKRASVGNGDMAKRAKGACESNRGILSSLSNMLKTLVEKVRSFAIRLGMLSPRPVAVPARPQESPATPPKAPSMPPPLAETQAGLGKPSSPERRSSTEAQAPASTKESGPPENEGIKEPADAPAKRAREDHLAEIRGRNNGTPNQVEAEEKEPAATPAKRAREDHLAAIRGHNNGTPNQVEAEEKEPAAAPQSPRANLLAGIQNRVQLKEVKTEEQKPAADPFSPPASNLDRTLLEALAANRKHMESDLDDDDDDEASSSASNSDTSNSSAAAPQSPTTGAITGSKTPSVPPKTGEPAVTLRPSMKGVFAEIQGSPVKLNEVKEEDKVPVTSKKGGLFSNLDPDMLARLGKINTDDSDSLQGDDVW